MLKSKIQGVGLGLRFRHIDTILELTPKVPWFEVIIEDFLEDGPHHRKLEKIRERYPIVFHSVGLNLGGVDAFDLERLTSMKDLYEKFQPEWISDHLCWSSHRGSFHHDLLPIPKTKEGLSNVSERINYLQSFFKRKLVIENITSYIDYKTEEYEEIDFIENIVKNTGCELLLDITNVSINCKNRGIDSSKFFSEFPFDFVKQGHLSGASEDGNILIDSHSNSVQKKDIEILKKIYSNGFKFPVMIERDSNIPAFEVLEAERLALEKGLYGI